MTNLVGAGFIAAVLAVGPAMAADMPIKAPLYEAAPAPYSWTGFYVGANLGYGVARDPSSLAGPLIGGPAGFGPETFNLQPRGVLGGLQAGYNWQFSNWVLGVETDIQASAQSDSHTCLDGLCNPGEFATIKQEMPWLGTTRGRIGFASGPILTYFTGGAAYGKAQTNINIVDTAVSGDSGALNLSATRTGFTYGSGVEVALDGNWTAKAEYLYVDLGSQGGTARLAPGGTTAVFNTRFQEYLFRGGLNYRLGGAGVAAPQPTMNWAGLYLGGNVGYGLARDPSKIAATAPVNPANETFDLAPRGSLGGVQGGYNWQMARWVFGLETDIQGSGQDDHQTCIIICDLVNGNAAASIQQKLTWFGTSRARLGYGFGPALVYATGGLAYGRAREHINETIVGFAPAVFDFSHTQTGFAAGAGIEHKADVFGLLGPNWIVRTEYLYVDLGTFSDSYNYAAIPHTLSGSIHEHVFRSALSYKFGG